MVGTGRQGIEVAGGWDRVQQAFGRAEREPLAEGLRQAARGTGREVGIGSTTVVVVRGGAEIVANAVTQLRGRGTGRGRAGGRGGEAAYVEERVRAGGVDIHVLGDGFGVEQAFGASEGKALAVHIGAASGTASGPVAVGAATVVVVGIGLVIAVDVAGVGTDTDRGGTDSSGQGKKNERQHRETSGNTVG